ncbi:MAG TPA: glycosyltransferase family 4 protein [Candidatus Sulfotelmatobacter sp.]|nr:glycosyltransferase family 4 protein [Candidatus Sulfotelmatobacter sp.]
MTPRLVIITEIISPYRIPLFNALHDDGAVRLHVIFLAETDRDLREWRVSRNQIRFSYEVLPCWRKRVGKYNVLLNRQVWKSLNHAAPDAILCGGYNYLASWQALCWARYKKVPFLLWSESNVQDARHGHTAVEMLKSEFIRRCDAFVVPGCSSLEYLKTYGIPDNRIFTAPNAVDNEFFAASAAKARQDLEATRSRLGLPQRYLLFVGRLVREKGVFDLLSAYAKLDEHLRENVGLVFVGGGAARHELELQAGSVSPGGVRFAGFVDQEHLGEYYALAETLILPTYSDTWGLVVNEAMACGLPVVVSQVAGCATDLVTEGWNGILVAPKDVSSLSSAIKQIATRQLLRTDMAANSLRRICRFSAKEWSRGIGQAIQSILRPNE